MYSFERSDHPTCAITIPPRRYATFPASFSYRGLPENQFCRIPVSRAHHPWTRLPAHRKRTWRNLHKYQIEYLRYRASLHPRPPSGKHSRRFSSQIYIYLFAAIRFVIGRLDKLSSLARRLVRSICDMYRIRQKKKEGRERKKLRTEILRSFEIYRYAANSCIRHREHDSHSPRCKS